MASCQHSPWDVTEPTRTLYLLWASLFPVVTEEWWRKRSSPGSLGLGDNPCAPRIPRARILETCCVKSRGEGQTWSTRLSVCMLPPWPLALKAMWQRRGGDPTSFPLSGVSYLPGSWERLQPLSLPLPSLPRSSSLSLRLSPGKASREAQGKGWEREEGQSETQLGTQRSLC